MKTSENAAHHRATARSLRQIGAHIGTLAERMYERGGQSRDPDVFSGSRRWRASMALLCQ